MLVSVSLLINDRSNPPQRVLDLFALLEFGNREAQGRWGHEEIGGGKHHSICVDKSDESYVFTQGGYVIDKYKIHW